MRGDFRETLSKQPDFWTKSYDSILEFGGTGPIQLEPQGLEKSGPLRHHIFSFGFGVSF